MNAAQMAGTSPPSAKLKDVNVKIFRARSAGSDKRDYADKHPLRSPVYCSDISDEYKDQFQNLVALDRESLTEVWR